MPMAPQQRGYLRMPWPPVLQPLAAEDVDHVPINIGSDCAAGNEPLHRRKIRVNGAKDSSAEPGTYVWPEAEHRRSTSRSAFCGAGLGGTGESEAADGASIPLEGRVKPPTFPALPPRRSLDDPSTCRAALEIGVQRFNSARLDRRYLTDARPGLGQTVPERLLRSGGAPRDCKDDVEAPSDAVSDRRPG